MAGKLMDPIDPNIDFTRQQVFKTNNSTSCDDQMKQFFYFWGGGGSRLTQRLCRLRATTIYCNPQLRRRAET